MGLFLLLKPFLPYIIAALVIGGLYTRYEIVVHERDSYKTELANFRANAEAKEAAFKSANEAITLKYKQSVIDYNTIANAARKPLQERIKSDAVSKSITIPSSAVRLFNESANGTQDTTTTLGTDDGTSATASTGVCTLNDILVVTEENNARLRAANEVIIKWQNFWKDYSTSTSRIENSP